MKTGDIYICDHNPTQALFVTRASKGFVEYYWMNEPDRISLRSAEDFESCIEDGTIVKYD